jgi:hypothetical protein
MRNIPLSALARAEHAAVATARAKPSESDSQRRQGDVGDRPEKTSREMKSCVESHLSSEMFGTSGPVQTADARRARRLPAPMKRQSRGEVGLDHHDLDLALLNLIGK